MQEIRFLGIHDKSGAEGGTRTRTTLRSLDPEPSVSTIPPLRHNPDIRKTCLFYPV